MREVKSVCHLESLPDARLYWSLPQYDNKETSASSLLTFFPVLSETFETERECLASFRCHKLDNKNVCLSVSAMDVPRRLFVLSLCALQGVFWQLTFFISSFKYFLKEQQSTIFLYLPPFSLSKGILCLLAPHHTHTSVLVSQWISCSLSVSSLISFCFALHLLSCSLSYFFIDKEPSFGLS